MTNGINSFRIKLDKLTGNYNPGEKITGEVVIDLYEGKIVKALKLIVKGVCEISLPENADPGITFGAKERYIDSAIILCRRENEETFQINEGHNVYPFSFHLPNDIPSTFKHINAEIKYKLIALMERPWKANHEVEKSFRIEGLLPIGDTHLIGIDETELENFTCWLPCFGGGRMKYRIRLPAIGFACGERIPLTINIDNVFSSVRILTVALLFIQKIKFTNREPFNNTKTETNIIQRAVEQGPFPRVIATVLEIDVQKLPLSNLQFCKYIDVKYYLHAVINLSGCHRAIQKTYEIVIGTKDTPNTPNSTRENLNLPSAPPESPSTPQNIDLTTVGTQLTREIGFNCSEINSEDPPPSYETVMAIDKLKKESKS